MHPRRQKRDKFELFAAHFDQLLNPKHELVQLAGKIDCDRFDVAFAGCYASDMGAPGKAKPAGVMGTEIWVNVGEPKSGPAMPPTGWSELSFLSVDTRTPYVVD